MRHLLRFSLLATLLCALSATTSADSTPTVRVASTEGGEYRIPIGWLNNRSPAPISLNGADARRTLPVPLPARLVVEEARLEMEYTNSISLLPRSQLSVTLNDRIAAQLPVNPRQPDNAARIELDASRLSPGFHDLGFRAAQHYTNQCEDPSAPELYSQIDAVNSFLYMKTRPRAIEPSLGSLSEVFDNRMWMDRYELELMVPPGALSESEELRQAASQLSQFVAATLEFVPVSVNVNELALPPAPPDHQQNFSHLALAEQSQEGILLGTREQLAPYLSPHFLDTIHDSHIGIYPADQNSERFIMVVSGTTPEEVKRAATLLNLDDMIFPDSHEVSVSELELDSGYQRSQPTQEDPDWVSFTQLGYRTITLQGMKPGSAGVNFWSVREMFNPSRSFIDLQLNYAYGAGFDRQSSLNVFLNGQFIQALPLQEVEGEQLHRQRIRLPVIALRAGINELRVVPTVVGVDAGGECAMIFTDNLQVTVFEDSRIELPPISDFMRLPDLGLFSLTGLPYTRNSDGKGVSLVLTDSQPETLASALTLVAKLRQSHQAPLTALRLPTADVLADETLFGHTNGTTKSSTDNGTNNTNTADVDDLEGTDNRSATQADEEPAEGVIVVGNLRELPEPIATQMTAFMPDLRWQNMQIGSFNDRSLTTGLERWLEQPLTPLTRHMQINEPATARVSLSSGLNRSAALVQFQSQAGVPVTVLTADDAPTLKHNVDRLVENQVWSAVRGAAFMWSKDGQTAASAKPPEPFYIGKPSTTGNVSHYLSLHPWRAVTAMTGFIFLLVLLTWWLLRRRAMALKQQEG